MTIYEDNRLRRLVCKYGEELKNHINQAFLDYGLHFKWIDGFEDDLYDENLIWIRDDGFLCFVLFGPIYEAIKSDLSDDDCPVLREFVTDITKRFIGEYSRKKPFDELKLKLHAVDVTIEYDDGGDTLDICIDFKDLSE